MMPTRKSVLIPLIIALCLQVLTWLLLLRGFFSLGVQVSLLVSAYLLGDALGAATTTVRRAYFSWLLPRAERRIWRQAVLGSCAFLLPSFVLIALMQGVGTAFWLVSFEWLALVCGMTIASWLRQAEKRIVVAMIPAIFIDPERPPLEAVPGTPWQQGALALLFSIPVLVLFFWTLRRTKLREEIEAGRSRNSRRKTELPYHRVPMLCTPRPSKATWRHWLRLAFFEFGSSFWWLPFAVAPFIFAGLLLLLNRGSGWAAHSNSSWELLLPLAIGSINTLAGLRFPKLMLSLRYPVARETHDAMDAAASISLVLSALLSNLTFLGLLWLGQEGLGWTAFPVGLLVFVILTSATIPLLQELAKTYSADSLSLAWLALHLFFYVNPESFFFGQALFYMRVGAYLFLFWFDRISFFILAFLPFILALYLLIRSSRLLLRNGWRLAAASLRRNPTLPEEVGNAS